MGSLASLLSRLDEIRLTKRPNDGLTKVDNLQRDLYQIAVTRARGGGGCGPNPLLLYYYTRLVIMEHVGFFLDCPLNI